VGNTGESQLISLSKSAACIAHFFASRARHSLNCIAHRGPLMGFHPGHESAVELEPDPQTRALKNRRTFCVFL
jgi:hypothetical protein